jgi:hypothetical protein
MLSIPEEFSREVEKQIQLNELTYGKEIRANYGDAVIDASFQKMRNASQHQLAKIAQSSAQLNDTLLLAFQTGDPQSVLAQHACELHKAWLLNYWDFYTPEAHMNLVQSYVDDARFTAYYDRIAPGCAVFLKDAMKIYLQVNRKS